MPTIHEEEPSCSRSPSPNSRSPSPNSRIDTTSSSRSSSSSLFPRNMMVIQVKTKEGSDDTTEAHHHLSSTSTKQDSFLRYSNDEVRLKALMLPSSSSSIKSQASSQQRVERKTRLSWELHPSLLIEDMLLDAAFNHDSIEDGIDIEDLLRDSTQMQIGEDNNDTQHKNDFLLNTLSPQ